VQFHAANFANYSVDGDQVRAECDSLVAMEYLRYQVVKRQEPDISLMDDLKRVNLPLIPESVIGSTWRSVERW